MAEICDRCRCDRQFHKAGWCLNCGRSRCAQFLMPPISIEEEPLAPTPTTPEHAEYVAEAQMLSEVDVAVPSPAASITPGLPSGIQPGDQLFVMANVPMWRKGDDPAALSSLTDLDVLERFEAWRCAACGSRSWQQIRCEVLPKCRSRWLEPVTVEIRRREVD